MTTPRPDYRRSSPAPDDEPPAWTDADEDRLSLDESVTTPERPEDLLRELVENGSTRYTEEYVDKTRAALDTLIRERDEAREQVEELGAERDIEVTENRNLAARLAKLEQELAELKGVTSDRP